MRRIWPKVFDILDDFLAYALTIIGILASNYLPMLKTTGKISVEIDIWRVGIAAIVALLIVVKQEALDTNDREASKAGRKKNFGLRMANALSQGIAWNQLIQLAS